MIGWKLGEGTHADEFKGWVGRAGVESLVMRVSKQFSKSQVGVFCSWINDFPNHVYILGNCVVSYIEWILGYISDMRYGGMSNKTIKSIKNDIPPAQKKPC